MSESESDSTAGIGQSSKDGKDDACGIKWVRSEARKYRKEAKRVREQIRELEDRLYDLEGKESNMRYAVYILERRGVWAKQAIVGSSSEQTEETTA